MQTPQFPPMAFGSFIEPSRRMAQLMLDQTDKLIDFQMDCARTYNDMALEELRAALSVSDGDSLRTFIERHNKIMATATRRLGEDLKAVADMSRTFGDEARKVGEENLKTVAESTGQATPPAGRQSAAA